MLSVNISNVAIIIIKNVDYCCIIHSISRSEAINLFENSVLENCGYIYIHIYIYVYILPQISVCSRQFFYFTFFVLVYIKWLIVWTSKKLSIFGENDSRRISYLLQTHIF